MNKEQILRFAFNRTPSTKGLIYSYEIDESGKITIIPEGLMEDIDENIVIHIVDSENVNNLPTEKELNPVLDEFISLNGREAFKLSK